MLKRKLSASGLVRSPSSCASSSVAATPGRGGDVPFAGAFLPSASPCSVSPSCAHAQDATPHLSSRTMKRFRNNRPSEAEVHGTSRADDALPLVLFQAHACTWSAERTLGLLYSAQQLRQQQQQQQQCSSPPCVVEAPTQPSTARRSSGDEKNQHTLHRFWRINSAPASVPSSLPLLTNHEFLSCEDRGIRLHDSDGGDGHSMELDDPDPDATSCF